MNQKLRLLDCRKHIREKHLATPLRHERSLYGVGTSSDSLEEIYDPNKIARTDGRTDGRRDYLILKMIGQQALVVV